MSNTNEKCYSKTYTQLTKKESGDPPEQADTVRKLLLLTCEESIKTLGNNATSVLYEENIQNYTKATANGKIYEHKICAPNNPSKWRSNLRNNKALSHHLKANVVKSSTLEDEFKVLQKVFNTKSDYISQSKTNINTKYINPKSTSTFKENPQIKTFESVLPQKPNFTLRDNRNLNTENPPRPNLNAQNQVRSNVQLKQVTPVNDGELMENIKNKYAFNKYQPYKKYNYNKNEEDDDDDDKFKYKKTNTRSYSEHFKAIKRAEDDENEEENYKNSYFKKNRSLGMYKKRFRKYEDEEDEEEPTKKTEISAFKSAREEFNIQYMKKYGTTAPSVNNLKRKRLGLGGPSSKFVSPMIKRNDSSGDDSSKSQECPEQILDERLKNIDPKMVDLIKSEIMDFGPKIDWNDIAGLEFAKTAIQEAVVWPMLRPDIFTGLRRPPKGILLFGPPGTGKTLIGKCVASQSQSTFFSISASSLTSKWIGDGEKMVRALFAVARCHQPAVIFIDEIDSLLSQRSDSEHESSRRIKTEFLVQLDGATTDNEERLLLIGATNRPQELDEAARRRFVKRLYIPLPELEARLQLVQRLMTSEKHSLVENNIAEIAKLSDGYSGADMRNLCADACMGPIRSIDISQIQNIQAQEVRPVSMVDFTKSLCRVRPSVSNKDLDQYITWDKTYGSGAF